MVYWLMIYAGLEKVLQPDSWFSNGHYAQNQPPTQNASQVHHFNGSRTFRLRAAVKLFPGLVGGYNKYCLISWQQTLSIALP